MQKTALLNKLINSFPDYTKLCVMMCSIALYNTIKTKTNIQQVRTGAGDFDHMHRTVVKSDRGI